MSTSVRVGIGAVRGRALEWQRRTLLARRWNERPVTPLKILAKWVVGGLAIGLFVGLQGLLFGNYTINQVLLIVAAPVAACLVVGSVVAALHGEKPAYVQSSAPPTTPARTPARRKVLLVLPVLFVFVVVEIASHVRRSGRSTLLYVSLMGLATVALIAEFIPERRGRHRSRDGPGRARTTEGPGASMLMIVAQWAVFGAVGGLLVCLQGLVFSGYSVRQAAFIFSVAVVLGVLIGAVYAVVHRNQSR